MLKKVFEILTVLVVSAGVYTLSKFLNTFNSIRILIWGTVFLYAMCGIAIGLYNSKTSVVLTFVFTTLVLEGSVLALHPNLFQELSYFGFLSFAFIAGYITGSKKILSIALFIILLVSAGIFTFRIYPQRILSEPAPFEKALLATDVNNALAQSNVISIDHSPADLAQQVKKKITLIDFYFADCPPCIIKRRALLKLKQTVGDNVQIILIDNGSIDSFEKFLTTNKDQLQVYYDSAGRLNKSLHIQSFPSEVILDKQGKVRFTSLGYAESLDKVYIEKTLEKIKSITND